MFPYNKILWAIRLSFWYTLQYGEPKSIVLNEIKQAEKSAYWMTPLVRKYKYTNTDRQEKNSGYLGLNSKEARGILLGWWNVLFYGDCHGYVFVYIVKIHWWSTLYSWQKNCDFQKWH